jgi:hypothetical protein
VLREAKGQAQWVAYVLLPFAVENSYQLQARTKSRLTVTVKISQKKCLPLSCVVFNSSLGVFLGTTAACELLVQST